MQSPLSRQPLTKSPTMGKKKERCFPSVPFRLVLVVLLRAARGCVIVPVPLEAAESWWQMSLHLLPSASPPLLCKSVRWLVLMLMQFPITPHTTPRNWAARNTGKVPKCLKEG